MKVHNTTFLCIFSILTLTAIAQNTQDTSYAKQLFKESLTFYNAQQYDKAYEKADSASFIFERLLGKNTQAVADALHQQGRILDVTKRFTECLSVNEKALAIRLQLFGENHIDVAKSLRNMGLIYYKTNKKDKTIEYYERALTIILKVTPIGHAFAHTLYKDLSSLYLEIGDFTKALDYQFKILEINIETKGVDHRDVLASYHNIAYFYNAQGDYKKAIEFQLKNIDAQIKQGSKNPVDLAGAYQNLNNFYSELGEYDKAIEYSMKELALKLEQVDEEHEVTVPTYINLNSAYLAKGETDKAIEYGQKALKILLKNQKVEEPTTALTFAYNNLGNCFEAKGDYQKTIEYYKKALDIALKLWGPEHPELTMNYNNLANAYNLNGEFSKALTFHQLCIDIAHKTQRAEHPETALYYNNYAATHTEIGNYDKAIELSQKALAIQEKTFGKEHPDVALSYLNIGSSYDSKKDYKEAIKAYQNALYSFSKKLGEKHPFVGQSYRNLANVQTHIKNYALADSLFQKALYALQYSTIDALPHVNSTVELIKTLALQAANEQHWYDETKNIAHLQASNTLYQQAIAVIDYQNKTFNTEGSKLRQKDQYFSVYEGAIKTSFLLSNAQNDIEAIQQAFMYNEQSKANLLQAQFKESSALRNTGIADSILQKEYQLRLDIAWREKQRQTKYNEGLGETDSSLLAISNKLFDLQRQYDALKTQIEKTYPEYYRLKQDLNTLNITDIQQKLLHSDQTLISYFVGDSSIYAFVIKKESVKIFDIKKDFPLETWTKQLREGIYGYHTAAVKTEKLFETQANNFAEAAFQLHNKLITPLSKRSPLDSNLLTKEVIIVPNGILGYIPFETLLATMPNEATKFKTHNYFGKNHIVSYNYSASLWRDMRFKKHKTKPHRPFMGFAPYFNGDTSLLSSLFPHDIALRKALDSLKYSGEEIYKAQKLLQGDAILNKIATKKAFMDTAEHYRILHLATHGKANDKVGDYCFLAFAEQKDSLDNELLYVRDIYNLSLNADMVVLSACETGIGELKRGEGIISLARAFAYAGAKSIVTTLWSVNDKSTMQIMESFYRHLKKGLPKDKALWQAKQDYLAGAKGETAHPFFWSAFIPIGDMKVIKY